MSLKSMFLKLKDRFYLKFTRSHESHEINDGMNEYDKMKIETLMKNELKPDTNHDLNEFIPPISRGQTSNRDVSAI